MPTIVTRKYRTDQVKESITKYNRVDLLDVNTDYLYMLLGKNTVWADEANPDVPYDSDDYYNQVWTDTMGISRILPTSLCPVVRRIDWTDVNTYVTLDTALDYAYDTDFYCINSVNDVFQCVATSGSPPSVEPIFDGINLVYTDGGYTWNYLYSISLQDAAEFLTPTFMPVNYGTKLKVDENVNSVDILGVKDVMIYRLSTGDAPFDNYTTFPSYRQVSLVRNPLDDANTALLAISNDMLANTPATANTGDMIYIENRTVIYRAVGQSEEIRVVMAF
jgi:hypothetical protein